MRLIDADKLKEEVLHKSSYEDYLDENDIVQTLALIDQQPTMIGVLTADMIEMIEERHEKQKNCRYK